MLRGVDDAGLRGHLDRLGHRLERQLEVEVGLLAQPDAARCPACAPGSRRAWRSPMYGPPTRTFRMRELSLRVGDVAEYVVPVGLVDARSRVAPGRTPPLLVHDPPGDAPVGCADWADAMRQAEQRRGQARRGPAARTARSNRTHMLTPTSGKIRAASVWVAAGRDRSPVARRQVNDRSRRANSLGRTVPTARIMPAPPWRRS